MEKVPMISLNSGDKFIPAVGFGTAYQPSAGGFNAANEQSDITKETVKESMLQAIIAGYRHFDTARLYGISEEALGEAIADALRLGYIASRDELFITSKLWASDAYGDCVVAALKKTLKNLGLEYLDLYLIHWPACAKRGTSVFPFKKGETYPLDYPSVWAAIEKCQNLGLTKSIGVSNFSTKKLDNTRDCKDPSSCQSMMVLIWCKVEMNPCWQQNKLREYCNRKGIHVTAYSPLGAYVTIWGMKSVMECDTLKEIALAKRKSLPQVCLRWVFEQGVSVLVKSFNKQRMNENLDIFDWNLSSEEIKKISQIPQIKGCLAIDLVTDEGPFNSLKDLWDDDYE